MQNGPDKEKDGGTTDAGPNTSANSGQTASAEAVTSKVEKDKQYGGAEVIEIINTALAADGRAQKDRADAAEKAFNSLKGEHEGLKNQFTTVSDQVTQFLKEKDEAELAGIKDNPPLVDVVRARQANRAEAIRLQGVETNINTKTTQLTERETTLSQREVAISVKLTAMSAGVDEKQLAELVPDGDPERLKKAANILKASGQVITQEIKPEHLDDQGRLKVDKEGKEIPAALRTKPASAQSAGGDTRSLSAKLLEKAKSR